MAAAQIGVAGARCGTALFIGAARIIDRVGFHGSSPEPDTRGP